MNLRCTNESINTSSTNSNLIYFSLGFLEFEYKMFPYKFVYWTYVLKMEEIGH